MTLEEVFEFSKERGIQRIELLWIDLDQRWQSMTVVFDEGTLRRADESGIHWRGSFPDSPLLREQKRKWWPDFSRVWSCPFSVLPTLCILGFLRGADDGQGCAEDSRGYALRAQTRMESLNGESQDGLFSWRGWFSLIRDSVPFNSPSARREAGSQISSFEVATDSFVRDFAAEWSLILERTQNPLACWFPEKGRGRVGFETPLLQLLEAADHWAILRRFARLNAEQHLWVASFLGLTRPGMIGSSVEVHLRSKQRSASTKESWESRASQLSVFAIPSINSFRRMRYLSAKKAEDFGGSDLLGRDDRTAWPTDGQMNPYLLLASLAQAWIAGPAQFDDTQRDLDLEAFSVRESWLRAGNLDFLIEGQVFSWEGINEYKRRRVHEEDQILQIPGCGDWELE